MDFFVENIMKAYLFSFSLLLLACFSLNGQRNIFDWKWSAKQISDTEFELIFETKLQAGWFTYSQFIGADGPVPTSFNYEDLGGAELKGKATESSNKATNRIEKMDKIFEMSLVKFREYYKSTQRITVPSGETPTIKGYIEAQACDHEKCLAPQGPNFEINLANYVSKRAKDNLPKAGIKETDPATDTDTDNAKDRSEINSPAEIKRRKRLENEGKLEPVKWKWTAKDLGEGVYELNFVATIQEGWHIYSTDIGAGGPIKTAIYFDEETAKNVEIQGNPVENTSAATNRSQRVDPLFDNMNLIKFKKDYNLSYKIQVKDKRKSIRGFIEFQACDKERCLPPGGPDFSLSLGNLPLSGETEKGASADGKWIPKDETVQASLKAAENCGEATQESDSVLFIFLFGFLGGLFALLTPCVFPMVPLTVSYFTKRSKSKAAGIRNGFIYAASIVVIYVSMGLLITLVFGGKALNDMSTNYLFNLFFFVLFIAFALSFFGYYDIQLPTSWTTKTDAAADKDGMLGIFFMAFTLSLVSFSCTGPIIGTLLVQAADGGFLAPLMGMSGFALALALPFGLFSAFPVWLQSLPKSGGWMNTVKVVLAFVELGLALKFLSKADQVEGWHLLRYETYMALTLLCLLGLVSYLLGLIRFPHDPPKSKISMGRGIFAVSVLVFAAYLCTGFIKNERTGTYATPWIISGLAPPACDSYIYECKCPAGLQCDKPKTLSEYYALQKKAATANSGEPKPILIDFTGYGCENCRKMEDNVWIKDKVFSLLNDNYMLISLYTDERTRLTRELQTPDRQTLRNVGNMWAAYQAANFEQITQPLYVLMAPDGTVLNKPIGAVFDEEAYAAFLQCGLDNFEKWKQVQLKL